MKSLLGLGLSDKFQLLGSSFVAQALRIGTTIILARLLTPADYGIVALVTSLPGLLSSLGDFGALRCLVQIRDLAEEEVRDTAFVLGMGLSVLYALVATGCAIWLSVAYQDTRLIGIGAIHGITGILAMFYSFQMAMLSRSLNFRTESFQNLVFAAAQAVSGIAFALLGFSAYALVLQGLSAQLIGAVLMARSVPFHYPVHFSRETFRRFWDLGWRTSFSWYLSRVQTNVANLGVGFLFGSSVLGQFGRACQIRDLIGYNVLAGFDRLLFPLFASAQSDPARMKRLFRDGSSAALLVSSFGGVVLCVCGPDIVNVLLGSQWGEAAELLRILSLSLILTALTLAPVALVQALGRPLRWLPFLFFGHVLLVVAFAFGMRNGIYSFSVALVVGQALVSIAFFLWAGRLLNIDLLLLVRPPAVILLASGAALAVMWFIRTKLTGPYDIQLRIVAPLLCAGGVFLLVLWAIDRGLVERIFGFIVKKRVISAELAAVEVTSDTDGAKRRRGWFLRW